MPSWDDFAKDEYVQVMVTSWSLESYAFTYYVGQRLERIIPHTAIGPNSPIQLNTSSLSLFAPALKDKFPNRWMQLELKATAPAVVSITNTSGITVKLPTKLSFQVLNGNGTVLAQAFALTANVGAGLSTNIVGKTSQIITAKVTSFLAPFVVAESIVGPVNLVNGLFNFTNGIIDDIVLPIVNKILAEGFPLPSAPGFNLTSTALSE